MQHLTGSRYVTDVEFGPEPEDRFAKINITAPVPELAQGVENIVQDCEAHCFGQQRGEGS